MLGEGSEFFPLYPWGLYRGLGFRVLLRLGIQESWNMAHMGRRVDAVQDLGLKPKGSKLRSLKGAASVPSDIYTRWYKDPCLEE